MKTRIQNLFLLPVLIAGLNLIAGHARGQTFTTLHSFTASGATTRLNPDGANPTAGLILSGNTLYGTAREGGSSGSGTVFAINTDGTGFTNLYSFTAPSAPYYEEGTNGDGANPIHGLILSGNTLYGTTIFGGSSGYGTVFALNTDGTGFTNLHSFTRGSDGALAQGPLVLSGDTLYGTAFSGGSSGWGTVFALNTDGTGFKTLHNFTAISGPFPSTNTGGANPTVGLILAGNTLYGVTAYGGSSGNGTVFALNTNGTGFRTLHNFTSNGPNPNTGVNPDGAAPQAQLILSGNTLYGTAYNGGSSGNGTVFAVNTDGTGFTNLHSFTGGSDGANPGDGLTLSGNTLYGMAYSGGGILDRGAVFAINTDGTGFTNLHSFRGASEGAYPRAGLILSGNTLYGTAGGGGSSGNGTVFVLNSDGTGFTNLHNFTAFYPYNTNSDGAMPEARLTLSGSTLYGAASFGGSLGKGTVFTLSTDGTGFTNLHSFTGGSDGANPGGLILSGNILYGTAGAGGSSGNGTVFALNSDGTGFAALYSFTGDSDGANPSDLTISGNTLYGTASFGGSSGQGTVFALKTDGTGFTNLHSFTGGSDGGNPRAGLRLSGNSLYGTAGAGGSSGNGTVFKVNTDGTGFVPLHAFGGTSTNSSGAYTNSDGAFPSAGLILSGNTLYGTAACGGSGGVGTVFVLNSDGTGFTNLHSFTATAYRGPPIYAYANNDGAGPQARLILSGNTLYGTAYLGGSSGDGTVFAVNTDGTGFTNLHSFTPISGPYPGTNTDGASPVAGLTLLGNTLYGTAAVGGSSGNGTVFSLTLPVPPQLTVIASGANVILMWPTNATGFTLRSTTNLVSPTVWTDVSPGPVVINGQNTITDPISAKLKFYRLSQ